jgi:hypothetical protein
MLVFYCCQKSLKLDLKVTISEITDRRGCSNELSERFRSCFPSTVSCANSRGTAQSNWQGEVPQYYRIWMFQLSNLFVSFSGKENMLWYHLRDLDHLLNARHIVIIAERTEVHFTSTYKLATINAFSTIRAGLVQTWNYCVAMQPCGLCDACLRYSTIL